MARKSGLSIVANQPEPQEPTPEAVAPRPRASRPAIPATPEPQTAAPAGEKPATSRYAGQYHIGASYDEADETVEAFRALAFKTRRKQKDLLHEAMRLLVAHYDPFAKR